MMLSPLRWLLAIALAAAVTHATRLDQSMGHGTSSDDLIPYPECVNTCDKCFCTRVWPPEHSMCSCAKKPAAVGKRIWGEGFIPYPECIEKCDECTTCTLIYPIELAYCLCVNHDDDSASPKKQALQKSADVAGGDDEHMVMWTKAKTVSLSYKECIKTCKGKCACTLIWPPELATCICLAPKPQAAGGKALPM